MTYTKALCVALCALCFSTTVQGQDEPSLRSQIEEALKAREPEWIPIGGIDSSHIPLVASEKKILVLVWHKPKPHSDVMVFVYGVENRVEATAWLEPVRTKQVAPGWKVSTYQIGDEGYLSQYKRGGRFEIEFRRGNVVAKIAGNDVRRVKDFATCIVDQISANHSSR